MLENNKQSLAIKFRRMASEDIDDLLRICQDSFLDSLRWIIAPHCYARRWWQTTLQTAVCEVWVAVLDKRVSAFVLLVTNTEEYNKIKRHQLKVRPSDFLIILISSPTQLLNRAIRRLFMKKSKEVNFSYSIDTSTTTTMWIELIAVDPEMRMQGIGTKLLQLSSERASALGYGRLMLRTNINRSSVFRLYKRFGFREITSNCSH